MSILWKKLRAQRGETLVETLAAVLILALSATMLAAMTHTAVEMNWQAKSAVETLYQELGDAESGTDAAQTTVQVGNAVFDVDITQGPFYAYTLHTEAGD